jgi:hypothetical protein
MTARPRVYIGRKRSAAGIPLRATKLLAGKKRARSAAGSESESDADSDDVHAMTKSDSESDSGSDKDSGAESGSGSEEEEEVPSSMEDDEGEPSMAAREVRRARAPRSGMPAAHARRAGASAQQTCFAWPQNTSRAAIYVAPISIIGDSSSAERFSASAPASRVVSPRCWGRRYICYMWRIPTGRAVVLPHPDLAPRSGGRRWGFQTIILN